MSRRKGELTATLVDRGWPHQVALPEQACAGANCKVHADFCRDLSLCPRGKAVFHGDQWWRVFCFSDPLHADAFRERFTKFLATSTGSSTRITRAILLDTPLSIDRGEVTDKGSINQRAVLDARSRLIDELYSPTPSAHVITLR